MFNDSKFASKKNVKEVISTEKKIHTDYFKGQKQLGDMLLGIAEKGKTTISASGLLEKSVKGLVALGIPGLILLVAMATSGYAGAAAMTSALATLGGPLGMIGGLGVLGFLVLVSRALANYGLPKVSELVVKGLLAKGHSRKSIHDQVFKYPSWIISGDLRSKIEEVLSQSA